MKQRPARDLSSLPTFGFGSSSPIWWGTLGFIALEGTAFVLAIGTYVYLRQVNLAWPLDAPPPSHWPGTVMLVVLLASVWPNALTSRFARQMALPKVRFWLLIMCAIGLVTLAIRAWEFSELNVRWDTNAYGSIIWLVLGLHATHLITDVGDTIVLTALMFTRHVTGKRFSDVSDNAFYWYFVVVSWIPLYFVLYWLVRL